MRHRAWLMILVVGAMAAAACSPVEEEGSGGPAADGPAQRGGELVIALADEPDLLDPTLARTLVGRTVFASLCEKLYDIDADLNIVPQLAAALPEVSADGREVTIKLREGVKFNDGTDMDAEAVKKSLDRHRTLEGSTRRSELSSVASVEVAGPATVKISLSEPFSPLTAILADRAGMILSPTQVGKLGDEFGTDPVCVGPFDFTERVAQDRIVLERSEHYYAKDEVLLDRLVYRPIADANIRLANLRSGDVHVAEQIAPTNVEAAKADPNLELLTSTSIGYQGITFNVANSGGLPPAPRGEVDAPTAGDDATVRQAFELSLDREQLNEVVFNGLYEPTCSPISPQSPFFTPAMDECPGRDVAQAKKLLAGAGLQPPVAVELMTDNSPQASRIGQAVQAMAKEAGFEVTLRPTEFAAALDEFDAGNYQAFQVGWSGRIDPDANIANFHSSDGSLNDSRASSEDVDRLIAQARIAQDLGERKAIYEDLIDALHERDSIVYLYRLNIFTGVRKEVTGVNVYPDGLLRVSRAGFVAG